MPKLAKPNLCTGCTACTAACPRGCIVMTADADDFLHPAVDERKCVGCGLCETVCPVLHPLVPKHVPAAFAVKSTDEASRWKSTSGGVFPELGRDILSRGGAVFGAAYDDRFRVIHICAECEEELDRLRSAKYAQSDPGESFREVKKRLERGQAVLFSGTPCQVGGLKAFLGKEYDNLVCVDFVCHGVPSPMAWDRFLAHLTKDTPLRSVNLRAKDTGWSRYRYSHCFEYGDGTRRLIPNPESLYMKLFGGEYINRLSCAQCAFKGYARVSDLTIGDFWGIWDIDPEMDDDKGTSVVLVQSDRGRTLWNAIAPRLAFKKVTLEQASRENGSMLHSSAVSPRRDEILERIRHGDIGSCVDLFLKPVPSLRQRVSGLFHRLLHRR